ncbi:MAG: hypothetical protein AAFR39_13025, partial [Pseudomonadota bacterium]
MKLKLALLAATIFGAVSAAPTVTAAQEPFIGELRLFANNFCPRSWTQAQQCKQSRVLADGQNLPLGL